jgi:hypothetical protein
MRRAFIAPRLRIRRTSFRPISTLPYIFLPLANLNSNLQTQKSEKRLARLPLSWYTILHALDQPLESKSSILDSCMMHDIIVHYFYTSNILEGSREEDIDGALENPLRATSRSPSGPYQPRSRHGLSRSAPRTKIGQDQGHLGVRIRCITLGYFSVSRGRCQI